MYNTNSQTEMHASIQHCKQLVIVNVAMKMHLWRRHYEMAIFKTVSTTTSKLQISGKSCLWFFSHFHRNHTKCETKARKL